jgi:hypothetical protein
MCSTLCPDRNKIIYYAFIGKPETKNPKQMTLASGWWVSGALGMAKFVTEEAMDFNPLNPPYA